MTLGKLFLEIKNRTIEIFLYIWHQDYSILDKKIFGISLLDIAAVLLCVYVLIEVLRFIIKLIGNFTISTLKVLFSGLLAVIHHAVLFIWYKLISFWNTKNIKAYRSQIQPKFTQLFTSKKKE